MCGCTRATQKRGDMAKAGPFWTSGQGRRAGSSRLRLLIAFSSLAGQRVKQKRSGYVSAPGLYLCVASPSLGCAPHPPVPDPNCQRAVGHRKGPLPRVGRGRAGATRSLL